MSAAPPVLVIADDRMPLVGAIVIAVAFVVSGVLVAMLSRRLTRGDIGRNPAMGLRLTSTLRSDAAWRAGQAAFAPYGIAAGVGCAVLGASLLLRPPRPTALVIIGAASIWLVVLPGIGAFMGDLAARDAPDDPT